MSKIFLQAEWRKLAMANYVVDSLVVQKYLPARTDLDFWNGKCYLSLVGFMFVNTRLKGFKIPFHVNFEEVNLRFYVRYNDRGDWKRGVVFIKEIVPKPALTWVANTIYNENYETMLMKHMWTRPDTSSYRLTVEYQWKKNNWNSFSVVAQNQREVITPGSEEEFITEHYWGYTKLSNNKTSEYGVEHPKWEIYPTIEHAIVVDFGEVYGQEFEFLKHQKPDSVFLAEGSEIVVRAGKKI